MKKLSMVVVFILLCAMVFPVSAQKLGFNGFGVHGNLVFPENHKTGFGVGGSVNMGELSDNIYLVPFADFWTAGWDIAGIDASTTDIAIGADAIYFLDRKPQGVYFGGGLDINFLSWEAPSFEVVYQGGFPVGTRETTVIYSETRFGFHPMGGYVFDLSGTKAFVEAKYLIISDFNTFMISVGALFGK